MKEERENVKDREGEEEDRRGRGNRGQMRGSDLGERTEEAGKETNKGKETVKGREGKRMMEKARRQNRIG